MRLTLKKKEDTLSDPARFAQAIRGLAYDAHRTLTHSPSPAALRRLARRIESCRLPSGTAAAARSGAWLDNLGREVRSAAAHRTEASRPMCLCA